MKIAIRADASIEMGSGHVMRCLSLAEALKKKGATVSFVCRFLPGNLIALVEQKGFVVKGLPAAAAPRNSLAWNTHAGWLRVPQQQDATETLAALEGDGRFDWLIVDHYALDALWEGSFQPVVRKLMVIDDVADRRHVCDLLLDQNLYPRMGERYQGLVPKHCRQLLGPEYALLRDEFQEGRRVAKEHDGAVQHVLVFLGGSDPNNITLKVIDALFMLNRQNFYVDVVVGSMYPNLEELKSRINDHPRFVLHVQVKNMAELMIQADLMIGAGGSTTWERCCLGLPALILSIADNQVEIARTVDEQGAACYLGRAEVTSSKSIATALDQLMHNPSRVKSMSDNARRLVDGLGVERVVKELLKC